MKLIKNATFCNVDARSENFKFDVRMSKSILHTEVLGMCKTIHPMWEEKKRALSIHIINKDVKVEVSALKFSIICLILNQMHV